MNASPQQPQAPAASPLPSMLAALGPMLPQMLASAAAKLDAMPDAELAALAAKVVAGAGRARARRLAFAVMRATLSFQPLELDVWAKLPLELADAPEFAEAQHARGWIRVAPIAPTLPSSPAPTSTVEAGAAGSPIPPSPSTAASGASGGQ